MLVDRCRLSDQENWLFPPYMHSCASHGPAAGRSPSAPKRIELATGRSATLHLRGCDRSGRGSRLPSLRGLCSLGIVIDATDALVDVGIDNGIVVGPPRRGSSPPRGPGRASCAGLALPTAGSQRAPVVCCRAIPHFRRRLGRWKGVAASLTRNQHALSAVRAFHILTVEYIGAFF